MATETISIGGLSVTLTLDDKSVAETKGRVKQGFTEIERSSASSMSIVSGNVSRAVLAIGAAFSGAAYAAVKSIQSMAEMGRFAQALGMTSEQMSRLEYASGTAGVKIDQLKTSVITLSKGLEEAAGTGYGNAAAALQVLGVSAGKSGGQIRPVRDVILDVADKMSRMQDGANKTSLAVALFGDAGAAMIPMLNQGSAAIKDLEAKADELGITIGSKTSKDAEKLYNSLGEMGKISSSITNQIMQQMMPAFQQVADSMLETMRSSDFMKGAVDASTTVLKAMTIVAKNLWMEFRNALTMIGAVGSAFWALATGDFSKAKEIMVEALKTMEDRFEQTRNEAAAIWSGWTASVSVATQETEKQNKTMANQLPTLRDALKAQELRREKEAQIKAMMEQQYQIRLQYLETLDAEAKALKGEFKSPYEKYEDSLRNIQTLQQNRVLDEETASKASQRAAFVMADGYLGAASAISGALSQLFTENKAFAIANALVNTAQGVTKALASSPPPLNFIQAAAVAAAGFAQVRAIQSASKGSSGGASTVSSGPRTAASSQVAQQATAAPQTLFVQGINPNSLFSGDAVRNLAQKLLDFQRDGGKVVLGAV